VEQGLRALSERPGGALASELPRQAGARETRWCHLLSGSPAPGDEHSLASAPAVENGGVAASELASVKANVARLQEEVSGLKALLARVCAELGISR
jgi:uncharacterized protein YceH (UPF0502 family)